MVFLLWHCTIAQTESCSDIISAATADPTSTILLMNCVQLLLHLRLPGGNNSSSCLIMDRKHAHPRFCWCYCCLLLACVSRGQGIPRHLPNCVFVLMLPFANTRCPSLLACWRCWTSTSPKFRSSYDGPQLQFQGRVVNIDYCLLSNSKQDIQNIRCQFGFATAAISLAIGMIWCILQVKIHSFVDRARWWSRAVEIHLQHSCLGPVVMCVAGHMCYWPSLIRK